jgi:hypothetical protein
MVLLIAIDLNFYAKLALCGMWKSSGTIVVYVKSYWQFFDNILQIKEQIVKHNFKWSFASYFDFIFGNI